jgi:hypothetical protein
MRHTISFLLASGVWLFALSQPAVGFDEQVTHPALAEESTRRSSLDANLKSELGLDGGITTLLRGQAPDRRRVFEWLRQGSLLEDDPPCRAGYHFHNPLKPFTTSGVTNQGFVVRLGCSDSGFQPPKSSVTWGTGFASPTARGPVTGNPYDWDAARQAFLNGLTLGTPEAREAELARTFEALGHLLHLVQDLAVPAHARNDFPAHEAFFPRATLNILQWFQEPFERFVRRNGGLVSEAASRAERVDFAGQPVTRFWDTDRYAGTNPTADLLQSLAEYTNANFASPNTIFTEDLDSEFAFSYPRRSSTNFDLVTSKDDRLVQFVTAEDGREDRVLYLAKTGDGELIDRFLKLSFFTGDVVDKAPPGTSATLLAQLDDEVYRAYAAKLLPRAIGYGAALLDYFLRGKLDVDLVSDTTDPSLVRITGTNASSDALVDGTLTLYADDSTTGVRSPATALDSTAITGVTPTGAVTSARFQIPGAPERFVAVYQGTLGAEAKQSDQNNPGGVIGKVLGGYRVEELFSDGTRWNLRTPTGIVPLPILRSDIVDLRWGDADNTLVGRTTFGTGQPNTLRAYRLNRPPGSTDVPLRPATGGGQEVDVQQTAEAAFPLGLDVGGLRLNSTIDYQQYLISFVHTTEYRNGVLVSDTYSDGRAERAVTGSTSASFDWRLTLDLAKFNTFRARPYLWQLQQIGLTTDGRLVALVKISLTQLDPSLPESFAVFPSKRFVWCGQAACSSPPDIQDGPPARVVYGFGRGAANHWALVDVSQGRVVYSTAADGVVIDNTIQATQFRELVSGPFQGLVATEIPLRIVDGNLFYPVDAQNNLRFGNSCSPPADSGHYEVARVALPFGVSAASASQYRPELTPTAFPPFPEHLLSEGKACLAAISGASPFALVVVASDEARVYLNDTIGAVRVSDGSERVALLLDLGQALATNFHGDYVRVVAWDPVAGSASLRHEILTGDSWQLTTAARGVAVVSGINDPALTAVPLEGVQPATVFPMPLGDVFNYRALSPAFLYNVNDLKFYRYAPSLLKTALPLPLAAGGSTAGDYHAIRLR